MGTECLCCGTEGEDLRRIGVADKGEIVDEVAVCNECDPGRVLESLFGVLDGATHSEPPKP
jgi:hypothetical protein